MKKIIFTLAFAVLCGQTNAKEIKDIKVAIGSGNDFGPWHHRDEAGNLQGYDIDVGNAVCKKAGLKCDFYDQEFASIIPSVRFKKYDVIMSALTNNKNRRLVIDFTDSITTGGTDVITNDATEEGKNFCATCQSDMDVENHVHLEKLRSEFKTHLSGKTIAVQRGTKSHDFFNNQPEIKKLVKLKMVDSRTEVLLAVAKNEADIGFGPTKDVTVDYNKANNSKLRVYSFNLYGGDFGRGVGMGVRKDDGELKQKLSVAIQELKKEGKLKELSLKWFGEDVSPK